MRLNRKCQPQYTTKTHGRPPRLFRREKEQTMSYPPYRRRPTGSRPILTAAQIRALKEMGYLGPSSLHEDEAAALLRLLRDGSGGRKK